MVERSCLSPAVRGRVVWCFAFLTLLAPPARAQQAALVEALAPVLAAEDARNLDLPLFRRSVASPDSLVRRIAVTAIGRIRDPEGTPLLVPRLLDPDTTVETAAAFALGLLGDTASVPDILRRFADPTPLATETARTAISALARIGGRAAGEWFARLLAGGELGARTDVDLLLRHATLESWRLGANAPVDRLLGYATGTDADLRYRALYALSRLRTGRAGEPMMDALGSDGVALRAVAARTLTRAFADSARLDASAVVDLLIRAAGDQDPGVRINALRSLATFRRRDVGTRLTFLLGDPFPNVAVQAAAALGDLGGNDVARELAELLRSKKMFALQREALLSLARADSTLFFEVQGSWSRSGDWRQRAAAAQAWAGVAPGSHGGKPDFLSDPDPRVVAAALQAWEGALGGPDPALLAAARPLLGARDAAVRSVAADAVARAADPADVSALIASYRAAGRDSFPDAALSSLNALAAIAKSSESARLGVARDFIASSPRPADYQVRQWAELNWHQLAEHWGAALPIETGRTLQDYREIATHFLVDSASHRYPHVLLDTDSRGTIEIELHGPDAPLTVANFLRLVDRHYFDGERWHRVVPNFVVQTGDPRGDGWGGPGWAIRDEINPRPYDAYVVGMALSGPDTGGSQWFITLAPQPHLDGVYTVFGHVVDNVPALIRITQGESIRSIRRQ